ncbi:methyl-accepting chemotaxis protein [Vibrio sp. WXL103]|uniref:methyl-accepting chemotaxis protein n=1 Tax=Vibrio sp. WXL103 TaxID=3450710 RepID=UPI003EC738C6
MRLFRINISHAVLMVFISFIVSLSVMGYAFFLQFRQAQSAIAVVTDETFPVMAQVTDILRLVSQVENATNQALFSHREQDLEHWTLALTQEINALEGLLNQGNPALIRVANQSYQLLDNHRQRLRLAEQQQQQSAALQVMAQRFSVLIGQQYEAELTNQQNVLLTSIAEEFSAMQVETINILNSHDQEMIQRVLELNRQSRDYIWQDFIEYSELVVLETEQGKHELTANLPWLLETMTSDDGIIGLHLESVQQQASHNQYLLDVRQQLTEQSAAIEQEMEVRRRQTSEQLHTTGAEIDSMLDKMRLFICLIVALVLAVGWWLHREIKQPMQVIIATLKRIARGDLSAQCDYRKANEFGQIAMHLNQALDNQVRLVVSIADSNLQVSTSSKHNAELGGMVNYQAIEQTDRSVSISQAMKEMELSVKEISESAETASSSVHQISMSMDQCVEVASRAYDQGAQLSDELEQACLAMDKVSQASQSIVTILEVINAITEQTNLLALNAAIEAARAGESGRGFAVVADEVRQLARRTNDSTVEIQQVIQRLQQDSQAAAKQVGQCNQSMSVCVSGFEDIQQLMANVSERVDQLSEMNRVISVSTTQQSGACVNVSHDMNAILSAARNVKQTTEQLKQTSDELEQVAVVQQNLIQQFECPTLATLSQKA